MDTEDHHHPYAAKVTGCNIVDASIIATIDSDIYFMRNIDIKHSLQKLYRYFKKNANFSASIYLNR